MEPYVQKKNDRSTVRVIKEGDKKKNKNAIRCNA